MFEDSFVESTGSLAHPRRWTTALSFVVQIFIVGLLIIIPLLVTQALPSHQTIWSCPALAPPARAHEHGVASTEHASRREMNQEVIRAPREIPRRVVTTGDEGSAPPGVVGVAGDLPGGFGAGVPGAISMLIPTTPIPIPKIASPTKVRVSSGVAQGMLIHEVAPQYPQLARQARIQGVVVLQAVISKDGSVKNLHLVSGHPMLVAAAMNAVAQWRYRPYYLNGEAVEVDTQINVNFRLGEN